MADEKDAAAEAPKKSKKMMMMVIALALVVLGGGGAGAFFMLRSSSASAAPVKGIVTAAENTITVNLADGHYLKLGFALQQTDASAEAVDLSEAYQLAIEEYTGRTIAELSTDAGRAKLKEELKGKLIAAYTEKKKKLVMDVYFTSFVTQ
ncbi:flagellar basal body rod protein [Actinoplanes sp. SE50]|uniref:flagellar basal body-associated FliL family protein n=1 Tax=unclassified Actinoplanes TaxID=2626549 RepID=UPI00023EDEF9|nr:MULTISPECIES: flagellar basal body-associated FliL family protein [unclassified Actinoplanes]AEV88800.1 Flagellar fliL protein [Actinoplanes sp. SE50/110]ATO87206.1 flagellar basal body rod protein [Actinoplanes sp. SE50]SLM04624.1 Flagellar basal body associated protein fliL [Actinoplanes sp. SE50/110]